MNVEPEKDFGKVQFQEELNRWFENRGIIADLRSHLRYLMITALQNTKIGLKPTDRTSPKTQALNLIVAEYLLRHKCNYTLSVFTSEVPTLTSFSSLGAGAVLRGWKRKGNEMKIFNFQEREVEEIFNALGLPFSAELGRLKATYLQKGGESSLIELLLQAVVQMSGKLQVGHSLESNEGIENGERLLSEKWLSKVTDILLNENIKPSQITIIEEGISRVTESEMRRIIEDNRKSQIKALADRERRIQEYLQRHENEIYVRLNEAERDLAKRSEIIDEDLAERQRHLYQLVMEWSDKHEEIVKLSKNFYNLDKERKKLLKTKEDLESENKSLRDARDKQNETIDDLRNEISSLISKLREVTESNAILSERIAVLMSRENKEVASDHDDAKQPKANGSSSEIPLLWSKRKQTNKEDNLESAKGKDEAESKIQEVTFEVKYYDTEGDSKSAENIEQPEESAPKKQVLHTPEDDNSISLSPSSSSEEIMVFMKKKLQYLEEESSKISKSYLDYKLKYQVIESDSEKSKTSSDKSQIDRESVLVEPVIIKETKCSQTEIGSHGTTEKPIEKARGFDLPLLNIFTKIPEEVPPIVKSKEPTKRQLLNREYFLKSRQLLHEFEKQNVQELYSKVPSNVESSSPISTPSSSEESSRSQKKPKTPRVSKSQENLVLLTPLRTASFYCNDTPEPRKKESPQVINPANPGMDCLALLEEARIKQPQEQRKVSLRQQILLTDPEDEKSENEIVPSPKSGRSSSSTSGKVSVGKRSGPEDFW